MAGFLVATKAIIKEGNGQDHKPISIKSRKAKARTLQNRIKDDIMRLFHLSEHDVRSTPMGVAGPDIQLSEEARRKLNASIECKAQNGLNIWSCMDQAIENAEIQNNMPLLVFKRDRSDIYVAMRWSDFLKIIKNGVSMSRS